MPKRMWPNKNSLLIRADCSERMGTGHVMRCLALAQAAQDEGRRVFYSMAQCSAGIAERLQAENMEIARLACEPGSLEDAAATVEAAKSRDCEWIVLDGCQFDAEYQAAVKRSGMKLLAMDDLGALDHYVADIVVNQDPIADERLYRRRQACTRLLLGTDYTFLRREFLRHARPQRAAPTLARRLLLAFGGSDPDRLTEMALPELQSVRVAGLEAVLLVGPSNPRGEQLEAAGQGRPNLRILRDPPDIPSWMYWSDLAVIAAGSTLWELAYCRVPCIVISVSEDQTPAIEVLQRREACLSLGLGRGLAPGRLAEAVSSLCHDPKRCAALGSNLGALVDGLGARRVLAAMESARTTSP